MNITLENLKKTYTSSTGSITAVNGVSLDIPENMIYGIIGRSGAGKGYVCRLFAQLGIPAVDTDAVYREMTGPAETLSPCMEELVAFFGGA